MMWRARIITILACGFLVFLYSNICRADGCADTLVQTTYPCVYKSCSEQVTAFTPYGPRGSLEFTCGPIACCQQLFTSCLFTGNTCDQVMGPEERRRVAEVAATSKVLVADCGGRYALFEAGPNRSNGRNSALIDENILR